MTTNKALWKAPYIKSFYFDFSFESNYDFRKMIIENFNVGYTYSILVRVEYSGKHGKRKYGMLGHQIGFKLNNINDNDYIDSIYSKIQERLEDFADQYNVEFFDSIQLLFINIEVLPKLLLTDINDINLPKQNINVKDIKRKYNSKLLPLTVNSNYFGKLILGDDYLKYIDLINQQKSLLSKSLIKVEDFDSMHLHNKYIILNKQIKDNVFIREVYDSKLGSFEGKFIDTIYYEEAFDRMYNNVVFTIINSKVSLMAISKKLEIIQYNYSKKPEALVSNPFIGTFDIEAFEDIDGYAKVYAAGFCIEGQKPITFYLDNPSYNNVLIDCINLMLASRYNGYIFYVHNLNYDGIFIIHNLLKVNQIKGYDFYKIKPLYKDSSLLKIEISIEKFLSFDNLDFGLKNMPRDIKITFIDSSNLLKGSLRKLCEAFDLVTSEDVKGYFPYNFVKSNTLNYVGKTPEYHHWSDISNEEYNSLVKDNWNLKEECISYLNKDLTSLLQIMKIFSKYITHKFDVQMTDCLTISRLSLNIFLKHYLKESKIPIVKGNIYDDIKNAYYGGVTEVYKPYGKDLYYYDVNSLYPFVALNPMCSNKYTYLESYSNQGLKLENLFGFFYCEIEASSNYLGLLPIRNEKGLIMPIGKWHGWYFSEELKFAKDNGYKIKVIKGYNFIKEYNVFDEYVKYLYDIKSTTKNSVEKAVPKSLLNNLLGRFGLNIYKSTVEIVDKDRLNILLPTREFNSFKQIKITDNDFLISYSPNVSKLICESHGLDYMKVLQEFKTEEKSNEFKDVSLVISAAITFYARIHMSNVKLDILNKGGKVYYTDTDSIVTDITLDKNLIGNNLGQFKLERIIKEGYFISNKTYCLVLQEGSFNKKDNSIIEDNSLGKTEWVVIKAKGITNKSLT